jgi:hypothetical protein
LGATIVAATLAVAVTPANAVPPGATIAATVSGRVNASAGTCTNGDARAQFTDVQIAGLFTSGADRFIGTVSVDDVSVCLDPIVGDQQLLSTGSLQAGTTPTYQSISALFGDSVSGTLTGLSFTNLGVVSIANVDTNYSVNGGGNSGNVAAHAVVVVAPAQTIACAANIAPACGNPNVRDVVSAVIVA